MGNFIPLMIRDILSKTGWNENEILIYSTLLEKGSMKLADLSKETAIATSTIQYSVKQLITKRVIEKFYVNNKPVYRASDVEQLRKWMKGYGKQYEQMKIAVNNWIENYDFNPNIYTPKVRFFEGVKQVQNSYDQVLKEIQEPLIVNHLYINYTPQNEIMSFFEGSFIPNRLKKNIAFKSVAVATDFARYFLKRNDEHNRDLKMINEAVDLHLNTEINVYDNCVHSVTFDHKSAFAMIIEDQSMAELQKGMIEKLWSMV